MLKFTMGLCTLLILSLLTKRSLADVDDQECSQLDGRQESRQTQERSLIQVKRARRVSEENDTRTNQLMLPALNSGETSYTCKGCFSANGLGSTSPLTAQGFNAVRAACCTSEMAAFMKRMVEAGKPGMGVCASGGLFGTAIFFDCTDDNVDNDFDKLVAGIMGPGAPAAGGDCPWVGFPNKPDGCPTMNANCPSFPDATVPPCETQTTQPPTLPPTSPPTPPPTNPPTPPPTYPPTPPPTYPPTPPPTYPPTPPPTYPPTPPPTYPPTPPPTYPPTPPPTNPPTPPPTYPPTPPPGVCKWPDTTTKYSMITKGPAKISAKLVYSGIVVGGGLFDKTPNEDGVIGSNKPGKSFIKWKSGGRWQFKPGLETGLNLASMFTWSDFEWLANNLKTMNKNGYRVKVFTNGGTYNMYDMPGATQGYDKGKSLMVFTTSGTITLTKTNDGRQFGPTVLAPFAKVFLKGNAGFIDGCVIAREFDSDGNGLQMHGDCYKGPLDCR